MDSREQVLQGENKYNQEQAAKKKFIADRETRVQDLFMQLVNERESYVIDAFKSEQVSGQQGGKSLNYALSMNPGVIGMSSKEIVSNPAKAMARASLYKLATIAINASDDVFIEDGDGAKATQLVQHILYADNPLGPERPMPSLVKSLSIGGLFGQAVNMMSFIDKEGKSQTTSMFSDRKIESPIDKGVDVGSPLGAFLQNSLDKTLIGSLIIKSWDYAKGKSPEFLTDYRAAAMNENLYAGGENSLLSPTVRGVSTLVGYGASIFENIKFAQKLGGTPGIFGLTVAKSALNQYEYATGESERFDTKKWANSVLFDALSTAAGLTLSNKIVTEGSAMLGNPDFINGIKGLYNAYGNGALIKFAMGPIINSTLNTVVDVGIDYSMHSVMKNSMGFNFTQSQLSRLDLEGLTTNEKIQKIATDFAMRSAMTFGSGIYRSMLSKDNSSDGGFLSKQWFHNNFSEGIALSNAQHPMLTRFSIGLAAASWNIFPSNVKAINDLMTDPRMRGNGSFVEQIKSNKIDPGMYMKLWMAAESQTNALYRWISTPLGGINADRLMASMSGDHFSKLVRGLDSMVTLDISDSESAMKLVDTLSTHVVKEITDAAAKDASGMITQEKANQILKNALSVTSLVSTSVEGNAIETALGTVNRFNKVITDAIETKKISNVKMDEKSGDDFRKDVQSFLTADIETSTGLPQLSEGLSRSNIPDSLVRELTKGNLLKPVIGRQDLNTLIDTSLTRLTTDEYGLDDLSTFMATINSKISDTGDNTQTYKNTITQLLNAIKTSLNSTTDTPVYFETLRSLGNVSAKLIEGYSKTISKLVLDPSVSTENKAIGIQRINEEISRLYQSFERYADISVKARAKESYANAQEAVATIAKKLNSVRIGDIALKDMATLRAIEFHTTYAKSAINPFLSLNMEQLKNINLDVVKGLSEGSQPTVDFMNQTIRALNVLDIVPAYSKALNNLIFLDGVPQKFSSEMINKAHQSWLEFANRDGLSSDSETVPVEHKQFILLKAKQYLDAAYLRDNSAGSTNAITEAKAYLKANGIDVEYTDQSGAISVKITDNILFDQKKLVPMIQKITNDALMDPDEFNRVTYGVNGNGQASNPLWFPSNIDYRAEGKLVRGVDVADVVEHFQKFSSSFIYDVRSLAANEFVSGGIETASRLTRDSVIKYMKALDPTFRMDNLGKQGMLVDAIINRALHTSANDIQFKIEYIKGQLTKESVYGKSNVYSVTDLGNGHNVVALSVKEGIDYQSVDDLMRNNGFTYLLDTGTTMRTRHYVMYPDKIEGVESLIRSLSANARKQVAFLESGRSKVKLLNEDNRHLSYSWLMSLMDMTPVDREIAIKAGSPTYASEIIALYKDLETRTPSNAKGKMEQYNEVMYKLVKFTKDKSPYDKGKPIETSKISEILVPELESSLAAINERLFNAFSIASSTDINSTHLAIDILKNNGVIDDIKSDALKQIIVEDPNKPGKMTDDSVMELFTSINDLNNSMIDMTSSYKNLVSGISQRLNSSDILERRSESQKIISDINRDFALLPKSIQADQNLLTFHNSLNKQLMQFSNSGVLGSFMFGSESNLRSISTNSSQSIATEDAVKKDGQASFMKAVLTDGLSYSIDGGKLSKRFGGVIKTKSLTIGEMEQIRQKADAMNLLDNVNSLIEFVYEPSPAIGSDSHAGLLEIDARFYSLLQYFVDPAKHTLKMGESLFKVNTIPVNTSNSKTSPGPLIRIYSDNMKYISPLMESFIKIDTSRRVATLNDTKGNVMSPGAQLQLFLSGIALHANVKDSMIPSNRSAQLGSFNVSAYALSTHTGLNPTDLNGIADISKGSFKEFSNSVMAKIRRVVQIPTFYGRLIPSDSKVTPLDGAGIVNGSIPKITYQTPHQRPTVISETTAPFTADYSMRTLQKMCINLIDDDKTHTLSKFEVENGVTITDLIAEISNRIDGYYSQTTGLYTDVELKTKSTQMLEFLSGIKYSGIAKVKYKDGSGSETPVYITTGIRYSIDNSSHVVPLFVTGTRNIDQGPLIGWSKKFVTASNGDFDSDAVQVLPIDNKGIELFLSSERGNPSVTYRNNGNKLIEDLIATQKEHYTLYTRQSSGAVKGFNERAEGSENTKILPQFIAKNADIWNAVDSIVGTEFNYSHINSNTQRPGITIDEVGSDKARALKNTDPRFILDPQNVPGSDRYYLNPNSIVLVSSKGDKGASGYDVLGSMRVNGTKVVNILGDNYRITLSEIPGLNDLNQVVVLSKITNNGLESDVRMFEVSRDTEVDSLIRGIVERPTEIPASVVALDLHKNNLMLGYRDHISNKISNTFVNFATSKGGDAQIKAFTGKENINEAANALSDLNLRMISATTTHIIATNYDGQIVLKNAPHSFISNHRAKIDTAFNDIGKVLNMVEYASHVRTKGVRIEPDNPIADGFINKVVEIEPINKMADSFLNGDWNEKKYTAAQVEEFRSYLLKINVMRGNDVDRYYMLPYNVRIAAAIYEEAGHNDVLNNALFMPHSVSTHLEESAIQVYRDKYNKNLSMIGEEDKEDIRKAYGSVMLINKLINLFPVSPNIRHSLLEFSQALNEKTYIAANREITNDDELIAKLHEEVNNRAPNNSKQFSLDEVKIFLRDMGITVTGTKLSAMMSINDLGDNTVYKPKRKMLSSYQEKSITLGKLTEISIGKKVASMNGLYARAIELISNKDNAVTGNKAALFTSLINMLEGDHIPIMAKMVSEGLTGRMATDLAGAIISSNNSGVNYKLNMETIKAINMPEINEGSRLYLESYSAQNNIMNISRLTIGDC